MGRGSGGGGRGSGGNTNPDSPVNDQGTIGDTVDKPNASEAANALGLTPDEREHFVNGANANDKRMPKGVDASELIESHQKAVAAYARKYGRRAGQLYSRGAYWSLVRAIKTTLAVVTTGGQAVSAPAHAAVNAALLAAYWSERFKRGAR